MAWYDGFARVYDTLLERTYKPYRPALMAAADIQPGDRVLDLCCGTGQQLPLLVDAVGPDGEVVGVDRSRGMLHKARARVHREGWEQVRLVLGDVTDLSDDLLGPGTYDAVVCSMGLSALPEAQALIDQAWARLEPGGRLAFMDAHASHRTLQTTMVEWLARADLSVRPWEGLETGWEDVRRDVLDAPASTFGGELYVCSGRKPAAGG